LTAISQHKEELVLFLLKRGVNPHFNMDAAFKTAITEKVSNQILLNLFSYTDPIHIYPNILVYGLLRDAYSSPKTDNRWTVLSKILETDKIKFESQNEFSKHTLVFRGMILSGHPVNILSDFLNRHRNKIGSIAEFLLIAIREAYVETAEWLLLEVKKELPNQNIEQIYIPSAIKLAVENNMNSIISLAYKLKLI